MCHPSTVKKMVNVTAANTKLPGRRYDHKYDTAVLPTTTAFNKLSCLMGVGTLANLYSVSDGLVTRVNESPDSTNDHGEMTTTIITIHDLVSTSLVSRHNGDYENCMSGVGKVHTLPPGKD